MGLCAVPAADPAAPAEMLCCYLSPDQYVVTDNWHVSGLRGTGSCDFEARDALVPAARTHRFPDHAPTQPGPLYRIPAVSLFAITVSVVPLGLADAALDALCARAATRTRGPHMLRDRETVQTDVGRAATLLGAARAYLAGAIAALMTATEADDSTLPVARATLRAAAAHATETAVAVTGMLAAAAGSAAIFETHALERCARDAQACARHIAMSPAGYVVAGRLRLGLEPATPRF